MTRLSKEKQELAKAISSECKTPSDVTAILKELFDGTLEQPEWVQYKNIEILVGRSKVVGAKGQDMEHFNRSLYKNIKHGQKKYFRS